MVSASTLFLTGTDLGWLLLLAFVLAVGPLAVAFGRDTRDSGAHRPWR